MKRPQGSTVLPRRRTKRQHYNPASKRHLVELTLVPGASVARIALDHRINANIVFRWRRQYLHELGPRGVIEIELAGAQVRVTGEVALEALRLVLKTMSK